MEKEISDDEIKETFILMKLGKMTLTEVKSLTEKERHYLSKFFVEHSESEKNMKDKKTSKPPPPPEPPADRNLKEGCEPPKPR